MRKNLSAGRELPLAPVWFMQRAMSDEEREYLWKHFAFSAEQRPKAFNFFVVFSGFANGGILAAFNRNSQPAVFVALGSFRLPALDHLCASDAPLRL
jgi:hypothetical protein